MRMHQERPRVVARHGSLHGHRSFIVTALTVANVVCADHLRACMLFAHQPQDIICARARCAVVVTTGVRFYSTSLAARGCVHSKLQAQFVSNPHDFFPQFVHARLNHSVANATANGSCECVRSFMRLSGAWICAPLHAGTQWCCCSCCFESH